MPVFIRIPDDSRINVDHIVKYDVGDDYIRILLSTGKEVSIDPEKGETINELLSQLDSAVQGGAAYLRYSNGFSYSLSL